MDKAKAAVSQFVGRSGSHDTTVDERQLPAVRHEEVQPIRKEQITTAVDREVDQDHFHTTVQPIKDRDVLPEKHSHQMVGVQSKEFEHANPQDTRARLDREAQQFKDTSVTRNTEHIQAVAPTVEGERVHHHVHETVQPVIEKETIAPSVIHTTVPIHERHHAAPEHHGISVLPTKTMTDFKSTGQNLTGSSGIINEDKYDGCPRPYNSEMQIGNTDADGNPHLNTTAGPHSSNLMNKADPRVDSDRDGRGLGAGTAGIGGGALGSGMSGSHSTAGPHSSHLANKADPRVDSDRDGRGLGAGTAGIGGGALGSGMSGSHSTAGPHSSDLANKADPRVDSDRDGRGLGAGTAGVGGGALGSGMPGSHSTAGPHSSHLANKADPRVDSDRDGRGLGAGTAGIGGGALGSAMPGSHSTAGPHSSNLANKTDPRVDSDMDGSNRGMGTRMTGSSNTTTGPHSSNAANKLDPRVDSDRSGGHHQGASTRFEGSDLPGHTTAHASGAADPVGHKKPSLMDRLNPMKDSDGDGKKGFMK